MNEVTNQKTWLIEVIPCIQLFFFFFMLENNPKIALLVVFGMTILFFALETIADEDIPICSISLLASLIAFTTVVFTNILTTIIAIDIFIVFIIYLCCILFAVLIVYATVIFFSTVTYKSWYNKKKWINIYILEIACAVIFICISLSNFT